MTLASRLIIATFTSKTIKSVTLLKKFVVAAPSAVNEVGVTSITGTPVVDMKILVLLAIDVGDDGVRDGYILCEGEREVDGVVEGDDEVVSVG